MSGLALLSPAALAWLAAGLAILGLYFLKPRSHRLEVSSTWLWHGVLREESARSPLQWLRRHLLLLLQLLVVLLAALALARPALSRAVPVGHTVVLAIDASEAMLANDGDTSVLGARPGGAAPGSFTRLDEARARAVQVLAQLRPGDRAVVLAMADRAEVVAQGTLPHDLGALQSAINRIQARPTELNMAHALQVAGGLTQTARLGEVVVFTGGVFDVDQVKSRPSAAIQVARVGRGEADNQAITTLSARRDARGDLGVFIRLRNFGDQDVSGALRFVVDGQQYEEQQITLPAKNSWESVLAEFPASASLIQASFGRRDLLALDNVATAAVAVPPVRKVLLVGGRSDQLERALKSVPGVELTRSDPQGYEAANAQQRAGQGSGYDVYVFEGWFPSSPPPGHWVLIDPPAKGAAVEVTGTLGRRTAGTGEKNDAQIVRVLPSPLLNGVDLTGVGVVEAKRVRLPEWAEEVVTAREAPLLFMGYPRPFRAVVFAFDLRQSNLFGRIGFPILIANTVNWLTGDAGVGDGHSGARSDNEFVPGNALHILPLPRATRVQIETPARRQYRFDGHQAVRFLDTARPGAYTVTQFAGDEAIVKRVYVASVLQPGRDWVLGDLKPRETVGNLSTVTGPMQTPIVLGPGEERAHAEWWRAVAIIALLGLCAEWWWFHR